MIGRDAARSALHDLLGTAQSSQAAVLALIGEPGMGKTLLCDYLVDIATTAGFRTIRASGVQWESGFELAGMTQLLRPLLHQSDQLSAHHRDLLDSALSGETAAPPDPFSFAAATLACVVNVAEQQPLLLVVDDIHWLDVASVDVLSFVVRRLFADSVAVLVAHRTGERDQVPPNWPRHVLDPLAPDEIRELVAQLRPDLPPLTPAVSARVEEQAAGNPLAIHELSPHLVAAHSTGARPLPDPLPLGVRGQLSFGATLTRLDSRTRRAVAVVAIAGSQSALVPAALAEFDLSVADLDGAVEAGELVGLTDYSFVHPLYRAAAYAGVRPSDRRAIHQALAALNRGVDAERYAWHLDSAGSDPELAAAALETAASAIAHRAGIGAAAKAWSRSAELSSDGPTRRRRAMQAAESYFSAGDPESCRRWLIEVLQGDDEGDDRDMIAQALITKCQIAVWHSRGLDDLRELIGDAERLERLDRRRAVSAFGVLSAAFESRGELAQASELTARARALAGELTGPEQFVAECWAAHTVTLTQGAAAAVPVWELAGPDVILLMADQAPTQLWTIAQTAEWQENLDFAESVCRTAVEALRRDGIIAWLPYVLTVEAEVRWHLGAWDHARASAAEALELADTAGQQGLIGYVLSTVGLIAGTTGDDQLCESALTRAVELATTSGLAPVRLYAEHSFGLFELGRGRYQLAVQHLASAHEFAKPIDMGQPFVVPYLADYIEALVRSDQPDEAAAVLEHFELSTHRSGSRWAHGAALRSRAIIEPDNPSSIALLRESIATFSTTMNLPFERHRSQLELGAQLRRGRKLAESRRQLGAAAEGFRRLGATSWLRRATSELRAAGDRSPTGDAPLLGGLEALSPQQLQVALAVAAGATNREAAAALFISPKTVDYHLRRACQILGVRNRVELATLVATNSAG